MAKSELVHDYCDAVERALDRHPIQQARDLPALVQFATGADLYGYTVCAYDEHGTPLESADSTTRARWVIFDNVYVRASGGRSPRNADRAKAARAGFLAKGGLRTPELARGLWAGALRSFGRPAAFGQAGPGPASPGVTAPIVREHATPAAGEALSVKPEKVSGASPDQGSGRDWATEIVAETEAKWASLRGRHPLWESGFAVFYSPVVKPVRLMIVGTNPGGGPESFNHDLARTIPASHDYFTYDYPLALRMRALFEAAGAPALLRQSLKTNLNFFRSRSVEEWSGLPAPLREELEQFSLERVRRVIAEANPQAILAEGFHAFDLLRDTAGFATPAGEDLTTAAGQRLYASRRDHNGRLLVGIRHPTGARTSNVDWARVADRLRSDLR